MTDEYDYEDDATGDEGTADGGVVDDGDTPPADDSTPVEGLDQAQAQWEADTAPTSPSWLDSAGSAVGGFLSDVEKLMSDHPQLTSTLLSVGSGLLKNAMAARQFERQLKLRGGFGVDPEGNGAGMYDPKKWYLSPPAGVK